MKYFAVLLLVAVASARPQGDETSWWNKTSEALDSASDDDWSLNSVWDYVPSSDNLMDYVYDVVPAPVVTVAKAFFVADETPKGKDANPQESLINQTRPHLEELSKLGRETYEELSYIFDDLMRLANLDVVSEEEAAQEQIQIVNLRQKLAELDTAIREEEHDGIDNEAEQTIQEMLQSLRLVFTDSTVDDFWDAMNRAQLHIYKGHEVLAKNFGTLSNLVTSFFGTLKEAGVFDEDKSINGTADIASS